MEEKTITTITTTANAETTMFTNYPDVVSVEQLQQMLGIGHVLAYRLVKDGFIKARKVGREYKIPKINIIKYICEAQ